MGIAMSRISVIMFMMLLVRRNGTSSIHFGWRAGSWSQPPRTGEQLKIVTNTRTTDETTKEPINVKQILRKMGCGVRWK